MPPWHAFAYSLTPFTREWLIRRCRRPLSCPRSSACLESCTGFSLPSSLCQLARDVHSRAPGRPRALRLVELGEGLEPMSEEEIQGAYRVPGCVAVVFVRGWVEDGRAKVRAWSDSRVVKGLVKLTLEGVDGASAEEVRGWDAKGWVEKVVALAGVQDIVRGTRAVGLKRIVQAVQAQVQGSTEVEHEFFSAGNGEVKGTKGIEAKTEATESSGISQEENEVVGNNLNWPLWTGRQGEDVAVLLSGGVDSSVAMRLIFEQGKRPHPYYLKIWLEDELAHLGQCPWKEDLEYANAVCEQIGVNLEPVSLQKDYWDRVVTYTLSEARAGRTPNPDVMCNSRVKFGTFFDHFGCQFEHVVTGHYARTAINEQTKLTELRLSADSHKDQTYFLAHLQQDQLSHALFPLGGYTKSQVRSLASHYGLPNQKRKDSQGICFLGKLKFDEFLRYYLGQRTGDLIEHETGVKVGSHPGFWFYTLGQRRGIGLSGGPWHVVSKNPVDNIVYITRNYHAIDKKRKQFLFENASWISGYPPRSKDSCDCLSLSVKTRHGAQTHRCRVSLSADGMRGHAVLETRDFALAPGQFAVFYDGDVCLGSAQIAK